MVTSAFAADHDHYYTAIRLNEDGSGHSIICSDCGFAQDIDGYDADAMVHQIASMVRDGTPPLVYRGSEVYSVCAHLGAMDVSNGYLYIDRYGWVDAICSDCNAMYPLNFISGDSTVITGVTPAERDTLLYYKEFFDLAGGRVDSYGGFLTTRCDCGWIDPTADFLYARSNGTHEVYCPNCGGVYTGLFALDPMWDYECSGDGCRTCTRLRIDKDIVSSDFVAVLPDAIPSESLWGALSEVSSLLIWVIPAVAGLFGIRKGVAFLVARIRGV